MFNNLYMQYKTSVLQKDIWMSLKRLKLYEKVSLAFMLLGGILSGVFSLLEINKGILFSLVMILIGLFLLILFRNRKPERVRIVDEIVEPAANERMEKVIQLLLKFDIDVKDEKQLNNLINQAQKEQSAYDFFGVFRNAFEGIKTYILLPIITIFLSEFFKEVGWELLLCRAVLLLLICCSIVVCISGFAFSINDILNSDIRNLNNFIKDIEDIKVFSQKAGNVVDNLTSKNI